MSGINVINIAIESASNPRERVVITLDHHIDSATDDDRCLAILEFRGRNYQLTCLMSLSDDNENDEDDEADEPPALEPAEAPAQSNSVHSANCALTFCQCGPGFVNHTQPPPPYYTSSTPGSHVGFRPQGQTVPPVTFTSNSTARVNGPRQPLPLPLASLERPVIHLRPTSIPNSFISDETPDHPRIIVERQGRGTPHVRAASPTAHPQIPADTRFTFQSHL